MGETNFKVKVTLYSTPDDPSHTNAIFFRPALRSKLRFIPLDDPSCPNAISFTNLGSSPVKLMEAGEAIEQGTTNTQGTTPGYSIKLGDSLNNLKAEVSIASAHDL